jgi:hypothetical protein
VSVVVAICIAKKVVIVGVTIAGVTRNEKISQAFVGSKGKLRSRNSSSRMQVWEG